MAKIKDLEKENKALKSQLETKKNQIKELEKLNQYYIEQLKLNRQKKFGASSEKTAYDDYEQLSMFNEAESNREPLLKEPEAEEIITVKRKKSNRKKTLENLPVETIEYILEDTTCPKCKNELHVMTKEIRKELIVIPAQIKVLEHITNIYSCRNCEKTDISATIIAAESPKALIPKSMVSPSLMAEIMYRKYALSLPLDRQEKDYKRLGVNLSKQNLSNWIIKGANLLKPLCTELKNQLLKNEVLHADETTLKVLKEPGRDAELNSYMWIYRTSGDAKNHVVLYDYQVGRSGKFAKQYLKNFKGYLHTDGWAGYHQLEPQIVLCGCWAHARRKFDEAAKIYPKEDRAATKEQKMINLINMLFKIEKDADELSYDKKLSVRREKSQKVIDEIFSFIVENQNKILPQSLFGKAVQYVINQKKYLLRFLDDGRIELSNNLAERGIKPFVIGRKNWLFSNTPSGANSSAIIYSIIETAKENNLNPLKYLNFVFESIKVNDNLDVEAILPWNENVLEICK